MRNIIILLALPLMACQHDPVTRAPLPRDVVACSRLPLTDVPARDLTDAEVESGWKADRLVAVQRGKCLNRMITRAKKLG